MSDWWNNARKHIEEQKRQQEAEANRRKQKIDQERLAYEQRSRQEYQHLREILVHLGVKRKLLYIAERFAHVQHGETVKVTPMNETREWENDGEGTLSYTVTPVQWEVVEQSVIFTSRPYKFTYREFVETGWTGATQGSGGGHATGHYTGRHTDTLTDTRELTVRITCKAISILLKILELDKFGSYSLPAGAEPYYPCGVALIENNKERDLSAVEAELDVCLFKAAKAFDTSSYKRKPPFAHIKRSY